MTAGGLFQPFFYTTYAAHRGGAGGSPEETIIADKKAYLYTDPGTPAYTPKLSSLYHLVIVTIL